jgi:hypothetical protein
VPETAVHEYHQFCRGKTEVRLAGQFLHVLFVLQADLVKHFGEELLRPRILPTNRLHDLSTPFLAECVRHLRFRTSPSAPTHVVLAARTLPRRFPTLAAVASLLHGFAYVSDAVATSYVVPQHAERRRRSTRTRNNTNR